MAGENRHCGTGATQSGDSLERCYCPRCGGLGGASKPPEFGDYPVADGVWLSCPRCAIWWVAQPPLQNQKIGGTNEKRDA